MTDNNLVEAARRVVAARSLYGGLPKDLDRFIRELREALPIQLDMCKCGQTPEFKKDARTFSLGSYRVHCKCGMQTVFATREGAAKIWNTREGDCDGA